MKAEDLMVGDWVKCTDPRCEGHQVDLIDLCNEEVGLDGEIDNFENIIPIPLTPEILEKNGFPYNNEEKLYYPFSNKAFAIELDEHDDKIFYYSMYVYNPYSSFNWHEIIEIRYVHELQHALHLCGINKTITI